MRAGVIDRVTEFVAANPGSTSTEIARGVRARFADVLDVLASEAFSASVRDENEFRSPQVYRLASVGAESLGRRARRSQNDLITSVLQDGAWHTTSEIHRRCGFSRLNSRISELRRRRNMDIECRHVDGQHSGPNAFEYRLVGTSEAADTTSSGAAATPGDGESAALDVSAQHDSLPGSSVAEDLTGPAGTSDSQLNLGEAA